MLQSIIGRMFLITANWLYDY